MFAKGKIRGNGAQLARYLMTGEESERVELVDTRGLEAFGPDPSAAFAALQNVADANTRSTKPFFHGHIRLPADERLTDAQWMQTLDLMEKRLGFEGQPRIVTFHIDRESGDKHLHVGWFRIDLDTMRAIDPGLYKNNLRELCREQERAYGLRQLDNERQLREERRATQLGMVQQNQLANDMVRRHAAARAARGASQNETEESRRLGTDARQIRAAIHDCFQRSDSGRAFNVALEERGLMLANGDRRDCFVVIDQEGGHHALNKKLTGITLAAIRERFADLDRSQLLGVERAQETQRDRQAEHTAQSEPANQNKTPQEQMQDFVDSLPKTQPAPNVVPLREPPTVAEQIDQLWQRADNLKAEKRDAVKEEFRAAAASTTEPHAASLAPVPMIEQTATADAAVDHAAHAGAGKLHGLGKMFAGAISWLADRIMPTSEQTEQQQNRALQDYLTAESRRTQEAEAERDPRLAEALNLQTQTSRRQDSEAEQDADAERDPRLAEMMKLHTQPSASSRRQAREAERDRD